VRGVGSTLTAGFNGLCIGDQGNGVLNIASGGVVNTSGSNNGIWETCLARLNGSAVARVDGAGSKLVSGTRLFIGGNGYANGGTGSVFITGGGNVTAVGMVAYAGSLLSIDVGRNSSLIVGSGTGSIANDGVIRILAGAGVPSDATQYSPISAGSWNGVCQAIGEPGMQLSVSLRPRLSCLVSPAWVLTWTCLKGNDLLLLMRRDGL